MSRVVFDVLQCVPKLDGLLCVIDLYSASASKPVRTRPRHQERLTSAHGLWS